jgi:hypothetical protein
VAETLANVYACHYPYKKQQSARGVKRTPLYDRLKALGGSFRDVSGWECADWFAGDEMALDKMMKEHRGHRYVTCITMIDKIILTNYTNDAYIIIQLGEGVLV